MTRESTVETPVENSPVTPAFEPTQWAERLESLKGGAIGGISSGLIWGALEWGLSPWRGGSGWLVGLLGCVIAGLTGFLFGVTYRYVIRHDRNPHLKSGAVGAFALARGLAQIEPRLVEQLTLLPTTIERSSWALMLLLLGQNLVMLTIARWVLDFALARGWLSRFGQ